MCVYKSIFLFKKTVSFRKVWFSIPVFIGKVYFYLHGSDCQNNENVRFLYVNGSLENTKTKDKDNANVLQSQGIREHVCEILEGGKEAFEKREHKYGFK